MSNNRVIITLDECLRFDHRQCILISFCTCWMASDGDNEDDDLDYELIMVLTNQLSSL